MGVSKCKTLNNNAREHFHTVQVSIPTGYNDSITLSFKNNAVSTVFISSTTAKF